MSEPTRKRRDISYGTSSNERNVRGRTPAPLLTASRRRWREEAAARTVSSLIDPTTARCVRHRLEVVNAFSSAPAASVLLVPVPPPPARRNLYIIHRDHFCPIVPPQVAKANSGTAIVTLWGSHARRFEARKYIEMARDLAEPLVILFLGMTVGIYRDQISLQGSSCCTWCVNPSLPETAALKQRFGAVVAQPELIGGRMSATPPENVTVAALSSFKIPNEIVGKRYKITAKTKSVLTHQPWYYIACSSCKKAIRQGRKGYKCSCGGTVPMPRYRITVHVTDPMASEEEEEKAIELICFGPLGEQLTGVSNYFVDVMVVCLYRELCYFWLPYQCSSAMRNYVFYLIMPCVLPQ